jgi:hypothetical protein
MFLTSAARPVPLCRDILVLPGQLLCHPQLVVVALRQRLF